MLEDRAGAERLDPVERGNPGAPSPWGPRRGGRRIAARVDRRGRGRRHRRRRREDGRHLGAIERGGVAFERERELSIPTCAKVSSVTSPRTRAAGTSRTRKRSDVDRRTPGEPNRCRSQSRRATARRPPRGAAPRRRGRSARPRSSARSARRGRPRRDPIRFAAGTRNEDVDRGRGGAGVRGGEGDRQGEPRRRRAHPITQRSASSRCRACAA